MSDGQIPMYPITVEDICILPSGILLHLWKIAIYSEFSSFPIKHGDFP